MELVKDIAAVIGVILSIITLLTACTQGGRSAIKAIFQKNTKDIRDENEKQTTDIATIKQTLNVLLQKTEALEEVLKQQCRDTIKGIYYRYQKDKIIPLYERKTADSTHKIYTERFKGNTYETLLYNEIVKWEIDTITYEDYLRDKDVNE